MWNRCWTNVRRRTMESKNQHACHVPPAASVAREAEPEVKPDNREVIRVALEAKPTEWSVAPGVAIAGYGFNGQVPGPVIEARQGVPIEIVFKNSLPEPTLIHWHGLRIPAPMDGTQATQRPVAPGETFTYRFTPP